MSAFSVPDAHLDVIAQFATRTHRNEGLTYVSEYWLKERARADFEAIEGEPLIGGLNLTDPQLVGRILRAENNRSLEARYPGDDDMKIQTPYRFRPVLIELTPAAVLAALACYEYQACETEGHRESLAFLICEAVRSKAIRRLTADQPWTFHEKDVRPTREQLRSKLAAQLAQDDPPLPGGLVA